ncbi:HAMP domain-containing sensor histidine kinase [Sorangium sp. So ce260]|uniref:HAMP domain-containing sensor histidine kinase n=1 Tax=Sorangium sp. So ce260 TaxID=3133291 RepID=UPI003F63D0B2
MESAATRRPPELRRPRQVSLSTLLGIATFILTGTAVAVAAALTVASTTMQQATGILGDAVENVRLADRLQVDLFLDAHPLSRSAWADGSEAISTFQEREHELRNGLAEAHRYVSSPEEGSVLDDAERRVDAYLAGRRSAGAGGPAASPATRAPAVDELAFDGAFKALDRLVEINLDQARASQALVARLGRRATAAGFAAAIFFIAGASLVLLSARRLVYGPIVAIQEAIGRYGAGDRAARAPLVGPRELGDIARAFNSTAQSLERQREAQFAFLGGVAHDLRNPLSALKVSVSLLNLGGPPPDPRVHRTMAIVGRQVDRLERMVGDLLDASQIEACKLELRIEERDLRELAQEAVELYRPVSPEHPIELSLPAAPVLVRCDATRIEQVLNNLLSNALKYSPAGGQVDVAVHLGEGGAEIAVRDRGVGIHPTDLAHLFEPFRRLKASAGAIPGTGLGLAVAKRIVEAHGGRLLVESEAGAGSVFRVELPRAS